MKPKILIFNSIREQPHLRFRSRQNTRFFTFFVSILYLHSGVQTNVCFKAEPINNQDRQTVKH